jgi:hypothetical protein
MREVIDPESESSQRCELPRGCMGSKSSSSMATVLALGELMHGRREEALSDRGRHNRRQDDGRHERPDPAGEWTCNERRYGPNLTT